MSILGFDTATRATTVALAREGFPVAELRDDPAVGERPRHATRLLVLVDELLEAAGLSWQALDRLAVGVGPGTFTGLRIGVATARALAAATGTPLVGVSTLHSLALGGGELAARMGADAVAAVLDARRGEVFAGAWSPQGLDAGAAPILSPCALAPAELPEALARVAKAPLAIGEGAVAFREVLERSEVYVPEDLSELHRVTAAGHCEIARRLPVGDPDEVRPEYLRRPDAQPRSTAPRAGASP